MHVEKLVFYVGSTGCSCPDKYENRGRLIENLENTGCWWTDMRELADEVESTGFWWTDILESEKSPEQFGVKTPNNLG